MGSIIDEIYSGRSGKAGKSGVKHRGRRARPSADILAKITAASVEEDIDYHDYNNTTMVRF